MEKIVVTINMNNRGKLQLLDQLKQQCYKKTGCMGLDCLDLGFKLPENFLLPGSEQPELSQLTVIADKLGLQIQLGQISVKSFEDIVVETKSKKE